MRDVLIFWHAQEYHPIYKHPNVFECDLSSVRDQELRYHVISEKKV